MKFFAFLFVLFSLSCGQVLPGRLGRLPSDIRIPSEQATIPLASSSGKTLSAQYLGCGGLYLLKDGEGILIDPFFSNQPLGRLVCSTLCGGRKVASNRKMVRLGLNAIRRQDSLYAKHVKAIFVAHSHYDHLLDVPAVCAALTERPDVYLNESGRNVCGAALRSARVRSLEEHATTYAQAVVPITVGERVCVYPILAQHNPHINHIKFFDGSVARPIAYFNDPYDKTRANDWLEGSTFSFLIDYLDSLGRIELRLFVQSSSCNPPAGVPPDSLLRERPVDVAFLGVASYGASPFYPDQLIAKINPQQIVWVHWEDFFRKYNKKKPKTVRGTRVAQFFQKPVVAQCQDESWLPWPRTILEIKY